MSLTRWAVGAVVAHLVDIEEVTSSNLVLPTYLNKPVLRLDCLTQASLFLWGQIKHQDSRMFAPMNFSIPGMSRLDTLKPQTSLHTLKTAARNNARDEVLLRGKNSELTLLHADNLHLSERLQTGDRITVDQQSFEVLWIDDEPEAGHFIQHGLLLGGLTGAGLAGGLAAGMVVGSSAPVVGTFAIGAAGAAVGGKIGSESAYALARHLEIPMPDSRKVDKLVATENVGFYRELTLQK